MRKPIYQLGNTTGQYFTQWRIDLLEELLRYVVEGFGGDDGVPVGNARIWFDAPADFHCLSFTSGDHSVLVKFYKVFSAEIDGKQGWQGCVRSMVIDFAAHLRSVVTEKQSS